MNTSCTTLAVVACSLAARALAQSVGMTALAVTVAGAIAVCTYWLVDNGLVALVLGAAHCTSTKGSPQRTHQVGDAILPFRVLWLPPWLLRARAVRRSVVRIGPGRLAIGG